MVRGLLICVLSVLLLASCSTQRKICPAYQSAFIFDKATQKEAFVHYNSKDQSREIVASNSKTLTLPASDSSWSNSIVLPGPALPKELKRKKTRYLLLPEKTYRKALSSLQTVEMKPVYPSKKKDSLDANIDKLLDSAARSINDTLTSTDKIDPVKPEEKQDSVYVISLEKEKFNIDQDYYMWYLRNILVLPDVRIAMEEQAKADGPVAKTEKKKKGFFGFFKNLFKKKDKGKLSKKDSLAALQPQELDSTGAVIPKKKEKKGFFSFLKKKKKQPTEDELKRIEDAKKKEEEEAEEKF
jgi:hypothetical protein